MRTTMYSMLSYYVIRHINTIGHLKKSEGLPLLSVEAVSMQIYTRKC